MHNMTVVELFHRRLHFPAALILLTRYLLHNTGLSIYVTVNVASGFNSAFWSSSTCLTLLEERSPFRCNATATVVGTLRAAHSRAPRLRKRPGRSVVLQNLLRKLFGSEEKQNPHKVTRDQKLFSCRVSGPTRHGDVEDNVSKRGSGLIRKETESGVRGDLLLVPC